MLYSLKEYKEQNIENMYNKAIIELNQFYEKTPEFIPSIIFVNSRTEINNLQCKISEPWQVGWQNSGILYILSKENLETESNHKYSDLYYYQLIKHELSHYYYNLFTNTSITWINEGLATYVSEQYKNNATLIKFEKFIEYMFKQDKSIYREAGFAIKILVEKFDKHKLFDLLKNLKTCKSEKEIFDLFKQIYGFELNYENMNNLLNGEIDK